jgi:hypothetical protein
MLASELPTSRSLPHARNTCTEAMLGIRPMQPGAWQSSAAVRVQSRDIARAAPPILVPPA